jgi:hypothetical protein
MKQHRQHEHWNLLRLREQHGLDNESDSWRNDVIGSPVSAKLKFVDCSSRATYKLFN